MLILCKFHQRHNFFRLSNEKCKTLQHSDKHVFPFGIMSCWVPLVWRGFSPNQWNKPFIDSGHVFWVNLFKVYHKLNFHFWLPFCYLCCFWVQTQRETQLNHSLVDVEVKVLSQLLFFQQSSMNINTLNHPSWHVLMDDQNYNKKKTLVLLLQNNCCTRLSNAVSIHEIEITLE